MDKKFLIIGGGLFLAVVVILGIIANTPVDSTIQSKIVKNEKTEILSSAEKVEVFLFHATQRCTTCIAIGKLAGEAVTEYFQAELKSGKIEFREINIDLPENKILAQKFQAGGSSLFINAIYDGQDHINEDVQVWRLTQNNVQFKNYLKNKIDSLFGK